MCYYGHVENTSNLGGDVAWSFFFGALVEIPAYSVPFLINRFGRTPILVILFVLSAVSSITYGYLPKGIHPAALGQSTRPGLLLVFKKFLLQYFSCLERIAVVTAYQWAGA